MRSMQLMSDEAQALTREIREQSASHLQAILDNVKDAIVTVDDRGHIETFNPTGERIFGYCAGRDSGPHARLPAARDGRGRPRSSFLERCAAKIDDTHVDLAAHQTWGMTKDGTRVALEIAVSKASLNRRDGYIVCIRDITERHLAEQSMRESEARYRTLVEHAPGGDPGVRRRSGPVRRRQRQCLPVLQDGPRGAARERARQDHAACASPTAAPSFGVPRGYIDGALAGRARRCSSGFTATRSARPCPARCASCACRARTGG